MLVSHKKSFAFIHIPKTGGTTIRTLLKEYADEDLFPWHYKLNQIEPHIRNIQNIITVVRHPYSRLFSYWKHSVFTINDHLYHERSSQLRDIHISNVLYGMLGSIDMKQENSYGNCYWDNESFCKSINSSIY